MFARTTMVMLAAGLFASVGINSASAQDAKSAEAFIHRIYAPYKAKGEPPALTGPKGGTILTPSFLALLRADEAALKGDVGVLDSDPICSCQDFDIRAVSVEVTAAGPGRASAMARFKNLDSMNEVKFDLVAIKGAWRIDDIHEDGFPSLRQALEKEIAEAKANP